MPRPGVVGLVPARGRNPHGRRCLIEAQRRPRRPGRRNASKVVPPVVGRTRTMIPVHAAHLVAIAAVNCHRVPACEVQLPGYHLCEGRLFHLLSEHAHFEEYLPLLLLLCNLPSDKGSSSTRLRSCRTRSLSPLKIILFCVLTASCQPKKKLASSTWTCSLMMFFTATLRGIYMLAM